ncbi:LOW QUALITY PROTEIN: hypothetical protein V1477_016228 [Vespula maculifrons]|uniref:Uncharacterized protein n=1 Tax=Vespula maculifrons TaxID=7453 RepID=A0ABD2BCF2_VESMC
MVGNSENLAKTTKMKFQISSFESLNTQIFEALNGKEERSQLLLPDFRSSISCMRRREQRSLQMFITLVKVHQFQLYKMDAVPEESSGILRRKPEELEDGNFITILPIKENFFISTHNGCLILTEEIPWLWGKSTKDPLTENYNHSVIFIFSFSLLSISKDSVPAHQCYNNINNESRRNSALILMNKLSHVLMKI